MRNYIPITLIYLRLLTGLVVICLSYFQVAHYEEIAIILLTFGLLTDVFDGIIARNLNISTQKLRRMDSSVDQVFYISIAVATYIQCPDFFKEHVLKLSLLLGIEALTYIVCFIKFKKEIATHSIGAKIWSLILFATLVQIILQCESIVLFNICFWAGILSRIEIIAIIIALKKWTNDVPTFYHALRLRNNKEIRRNKMFNG